MEKRPTAATNAGMRDETDARGLVIIWASLMVLTGVTVAAASINLQKMAVIVCLAIAAVKATLVLFYFMQLRFERRLVVKLVVPITIAALAIFIGLTFSDVFTR
jgi:cytochrome c oxidase subunit 4